MEQNLSQELSFEKAIERLESIVKQLESGDASLEESLALYEEGIALTKLCAGKIEKAEQKIKILTAVDGTLCEKDFNV